MSLHTTHTAGNGRFIRIQKVCSFPDSSFLGSLCLLAYLWWFHFSVKSYGIPDHRIHTILVDFLHTDHLVVLMNMFVQNFCKQEVFSLMQISNCMLTWILIVLSFPTCTASFMNKYYIQHLPTFCWLIIINVISSGCCCGVMG